MKVSHFSLCILLVAIVFAALPAWAQEETEPTTALGADAVELPWCVLAARPVFGAGAGSAKFYWDAVGGLVDYKQETDIDRVSYIGLVPEAFFMPTQGRQFIISASVPLSFGSGTYAEGNRGDVIDGQNFTYRSWHVALGLGYQWYFGEQQRTNLFLMSHVGWGRYNFTIQDWEGEDYASDPIRSWIFDVTVGSTYRFDNGLVLGGSLDGSTLAFNGHAGDADFLDVDVNGGQNMLRLNLLFGYAFF